MKKIAVGDLGEFWYGDYKEPFEQLEGGVPGHPVGVVLKADDGKLLCAWCGKTYESLGRHIAATHHTTSREYKAEVGLLQKSSLVSERLRLVRTVSGKRRAAKGLPKVSGAHPNRVYRPTNYLRTPERLNLTGRCYSQLLAVGAAIFREEGRITRPKLRRRGIGERAILAFWPSLDAFRSAVGDGYRATNRPWKQPELVLALRSLAQKIGRTPSASDLRRHGLPWMTTYSRRFGSYSAACKAAGLDPNLPTPLTTDVEVAFLVAYATTGRYKEAAEMTGIGQGRGEQILLRYGAPFAVREGGNLRFRGTDTSARRTWAAEMARRLAGEVLKAA